MKCLQCDTVERSSWNLGEVDQALRIQRLLNSVSDWIELGNSGGFKAELDSAAG